MIKIITGIILILITALVLSVTTCNSYKETLDQVTEIEKSKNDTLLIFKDKYGKSVSEGFEIEGKLKSIQITNGNLLDSIHKIRGIKPKTINQIVTIETNTSGEFVGKLDSLQRIITDLNGLKHEQKVLNKKFDDGFLFTNNTVIGDSFYQEYTYKDSLNIVMYWKWAHKFPILRSLWCKKINKVNVQSNNPKTTIIKLQSIKILKQ
jgi:hypothetical protein